LESLKKLATNSPIFFGIIITLLLWMAYIISGIFATIVSKDIIGSQLAETFGRIIFSILFLCLIWKVNWSSVAGVTRLGQWQYWLIILGFIVYETITHSYAMFGNLSFNFQNVKLSGAVALNSLGAGLIEEIVFRGIILYSSVRLWANSKTGIWKCIIISSVIFGSAHLIHILLGKPIPQTFLLGVSTFLSGIYLAIFVLYYKSIWPVVVFHGFLNALISIKAYYLSGFEDTTQAWILIILFQLPLVFWGVLLFRKLQIRDIVPKVP